ncbi:UDP-N-acetylmuramoyl-tripeptide--D-alanyl-D-alanine ligase [Echinimonas agarilytica]|uniref:UDP-N-acetylmuramoyl-tripeptide--D-alanyl-D-alanine ligase n=1 Tax=Echinimonas agarilytica TaxID=1215918 RepID=A0AA42B6G7_9GAMM|nr:UDP-N-acetylmuramoyl-tripeptide--D-alanyl-D-alanine ligase [Echinimonas agarilytica]MCM2678775.1 UDP-N-acetylmuramoyl-tripeptide--D-alanyl-D-alanine ligase [Echinimonas agarilytica]
MIEMTLQQVAEATHGQLAVSNGLTIHNICTDSRSLATGDLFIALSGERFDAHDYIEQVAQNGAAAVVVSRPVDVDIPQIIVADTRKALGALGRWLLQHCDLSSVAITGSSGKTTVKEMTAAILRQHHQVLSTQGNFNNEIGVPLTLLRAEPSMTHAVVELGASGPHEIAYTTRLVQPDAAVITNIGGAHLEGFGSEQGIASAKAEIFEGLGPQGTAIFDYHSPYAGQWQALVYDKIKLMWSSQGDSNAQVRASHIDIDDDSSQFVLSIHHESIDICLPMPGLHNIENALAAAASAFVLGVGIVEIAAGLEMGVSVKGRLQSYELSSQLTVIDDTYNANLASVKAAIDVLAAQSKRTTVLVFGDMGELGAWARQHHEEVGKYAQQRGIDALFTLGALSDEALRAFSGQGRHSYDIEDLMAELTEWITEQKQPVRLLVKGSRSAAMERVVERLKQWQTGEEEASC